MKKKIYFNTYIHYFIYIVSAVVFSLFLDNSMFDDGLRHVAYSSNKDIMHSWGEVFPHSLFGDYDPWFMWHNLLSFFLNFVDVSHLHILINSITLFLLMVFIDYYLRLVCKYNFDSLIYIIVLAIIYLSSIRYVIVRPDLLSGLYILCALLLKNKFFPIFILTIFYGPFYYLFFIYTGSMGLIELIRKRFKSFFGLFFASVFVLIFHLTYDFNGYVQTVKNILLDQKLRMGVQVSEGKPLFDILSSIDYFILLPLFLIVSGLLIYKKYDYFKNNPIPLFLVITSILWLNQTRYFILFLPLFYIYLFSIYINTDKKRFLQNIRKYFIILKKYISYSKKAKLFYIVAIPYSIFMIGYSMNNFSINKEVEEARFFEDKKFNNKTILLNRLHVDVYKGLYVNPTLKFIPSCSIGWFDNSNEEMKDIYIRMIKEKGISEIELKKLIKYVNADIYIHYFKFS
jgi:hypothetical protein